MLEHPGLTGQFADGLGGPPHGLGGLGGYGRDVPNGSIDGLALGRFPLRGLGDGAHLLRGQLTEAHDGRKGLPRRLGQTGGGLDGGHGPIHAVDIVPGAFLDVPDGRIHLAGGDHAYHVKDTRTHNLADDTAKEMSKTLTYFSIENGKPAFGIEGSKNLPPPMRTNYHLRVIESFLHSFGITFERTFELGAPQVAEALRENVDLSFFDNKIFLDLRNARDHLRYIPLKRGSAVEYRPGSPLMALVNADKSLKVYFGNTNVTDLDPEYLDFDSSIDHADLEIDGKRRSVPFGSVVPVAKSFLVEPQKGYRTNVIGFSRPGLADEAGVSLSLADLQSPYSVDKDGTIYRIEVYRDAKFCGMMCGGIPSCVTHCNIGYNRCINSRRW